MWLLQSYHAAQHYEKCTLYEGLVLKEIDAASYNAEKAKSVTLYEAASAVLGENSFTRTLVNLLIDKVVIYPGERVEVAWKVADFSAVK